MDSRLALSCLALSREFNHTLYTFLSGTLNTQIEPNHTPQIEPNHTPQIEPNHTPQIEPNHTPQIEPNHTPQIEPRSKQTVSAQTNSARTDSARLNFQVSFRFLKKRSTYRTNVCISAANVFAYQTFNRTLVPSEGVAEIFRVSVGKLRPSNYLKTKIKNARPWRAQTARRKNE